MASIGSVDTRDGLDRTAGTKRDGLGRAAGTKRDGLDRTAGIASDRPTGTGGHVRDDLRRIATFASGVAEITRNRAEDIVRTWSRGGDTPREQFQEMVRELMDWSRQNRTELARIVRSEIETQIASLGLATTRDVERLAQRVDKLESESARTAGARTTRGRKTTRTGAKKTTRKSSGRKSTRRASGGDPGSPGPSPSAR